MNKTELTQKIKHAAFKLGFQKTGIIPASPLMAESAFLQQWLQQGYHAEMAWMATHYEKRKNPALLFDNPDDAKSILCVGMNYFTSDPEDLPENALKIAKYAQGTDYHVVLKDRLRELLADIQTYSPGIMGRALTDSAPILEKPLAIRAGLGWQGKNANLLTQDYGSWLFLGELMLNIELDYDTPFTENLCGSCTRCIDACPTEAIVAPAVVDANRCISYWTIEYKGEEIPETIARRMNGWIFGCDICQDVCPWNQKFARETQEPLFQPRPWNIAPKAEEMISLTPELFQERYRKSPMKRAKLKGLIRNVGAVTKFSRK